MDRRQFLSRTACLAAALSAKRAESDESVAVRIRIENDAASTRIPLDFLGFGYEVSEVAMPGFFSPNNRQYIQFIRTLASDGVIRVGGNTADYSLWQPDGDAIAKPKGTVVNRRSIEELGGFLRTTGWKLIWVLNMGTGSPESAADQAAAVARATGSQLLAFEIGNEPDMFVVSGHRPQGYGYVQYLAEFRQYADAVRRRVPDAPLAGPAVLAATDWTDRFARDESGQVRLLTQHYYINDQSTPFATLKNLLTPDERLIQMTRQLRDVSRTWAVPWRIPEANSFSGGGKPGVSDVFAAALWALDFMFTVAAAGGSGVNFETGVNHLGFVSSYSPIFQDDHGYSAHPVYYAMLAFRSALGGSLTSVTRDDRETDLKTWAFRDKSGNRCAVLLNKSSVSALDTIVEWPGSQFRASLSWLRAPGLESNTGITFQGAEVRETGIWSGRNMPDTQLNQKPLQLTVPPAAAVLIQAH